jgi:hypothetical protein
MSRPASILAVTLALLSFAPAAAFADHNPVDNLTARRVVDTQVIATGPRWYFTTTPIGRLLAHRGQAGAVILGRDLFNASGTSAVMLEAHLGGGIGGIGRSEYAGVSFGLKLRSPCRRIELGLAVALIDRFDPAHIADVDARGGLVSQLAFDLDDATPYSTRIVIRAELHRPTDTLTTLDTFLGIGTRWH